MKKYAHQHKFDLHKQCPNYTPSQSVFYTLSGCPGREELTSAPSILPFQKVIFPSSAGNADTPRGGFIIMDMSSLVRLIGEHDRQYADERLKRGAELTV